MKKKFLTCMVALCLLVSGSVLLASCGSEDTATSVSTEAELIEAIENGGSVKLMADITLENVLEIGTSDGSTNISVALDLNGKTITETVTENTKISDYSTATSDSEKINRIYVYENSTLTISDSVGGGKITATAYSSNSVMVVDGTLNVKSGEIECVGCYGIYCRNGGSLYMSGGKIVSKGLYTGETLLCANSAVSGNNTTGDMNFYITGGEITGEACDAIYMPGQTNLQISGDAVINGGIVVRMGQIVISGGTIKGMQDTSNLVSITENYNVSDHLNLGNALSVLAGTYNSSSTNGNSCSITITGGTLNGYSQSGIVIYDIGTKYDQTVTLTINGGTIKDNSTAENSIYLYKVYKNASYTSSHTLTTTVKIGDSGSEDTYEFTAVENSTYLFYATKKTSSED